MMKIIVWLTLSLIWGTTWFFIKVGLEDLPAISFASIRFVIAGLILAVLIRLQRIPLPQTKAEWKTIALTGFLQFSINYAAIFWGEQHIPSGLAAVLQSLIPIFGLAFAWIYLPGEKITFPKAAAVLLGIIGVATIFTEQLQINGVTAFTGSVVVVMGASAAAYSSVLVKAKVSAIHPASLVLSQMLCGILPLILFGLLKDGNPLQFHWTRRAVFCVAYLATVGTVVAFWLYYWLLSKVESTSAMMIALATPLIAIIIGAIFLNEKIEPQAFLGGALILASIGLIVFRKDNRTIKPQKIFCPEPNIGVLKNES